MLQGRGLSNKEAKKRLSKYGLNEIERRKKINTLKIFISQFKSPLILILIVAAIISSVVGLLPDQDSNIFDTILILIIVLVSGISGFFQDYKAEKTIEALQKIARPKIKVIRDRREIEVSIKNIVPGDLILLEEGDIIPADSKIIEVFSLEVDESVLTGESRAVKKSVSDEIFRGTSINSGNAQALVIKTGMNTKIGKIASKLQAMKEEETPFQTEISNFSRKIFFVIIGIILVLFFASLFKYGLYQSVLISISLAVAAIPEGLPAVLVLVLAIGARVMANKNALVRKLNVVESAGSVDIICTDKTGTLTKNEMSVTNLFFNNRIFNVSDELDSDKIKQLLICGALCNNSKIGYKDDEKIYLGDQTDIALRKLSDKLLKEELKGYEKTAEISFTSERKMMSVIYKKEGKNFLFSKGAPEVLIEKCNRLYKNGRIIKLDRKTKEIILKQNKEFASQALRVLGFASKETDSENKNQDLVWIGLQ
ncbi:MAG TPA: hypothetical protein ENG87_00165, partial [Candidatus Pacearchaeota archaeon]|nr:hypothetical protein [Candidatus Pacearchaeota archaeon]